MNRLPKFNGDYNYLLLQLLEQELLEATHTFNDKFEELFPCGDARCKFMFMPSIVRSESNATDTNLLLRFDLLQANLWPGPCIEFEGFKGCSKPIAYMLLNVLTTEGITDEELQEYGRTGPFYRSNSPSPSASAHSPSGQEEGEEDIWGHENIFVDATDHVLQVDDKLQKTIAPYLLFATVSWICAKAKLGQDIELDERKRVFGFMSSPPLSKVLDNFWADFKVGKSQYLLRPCQSVQVGGKRPRKECSWDDLADSALNLLKDLGSLSGQEDSLILNGSLTVSRDTHPWKYFSKKIETLRFDMLLGYNGELKEIFENKCAEVETLKKELQELKDKHDQQMQKEVFTCPLCLNLHQIEGRRHGVFRPCGHVVCLSCLQRILQMNQQNPGSMTTCPLCRGPIPQVIQTELKMVACTEPSTQQHTRTQVYP